MNRRNFFADVFAAAALAWGAPLLRRTPLVPVPPKPLTVGDYVLGRGVLCTSPIDPQTGKPTGPWEQIATVESFYVRIGDEPR